MLPFIDEHSIEVRAPREAVWDALWKVLRRSFGGSRGSRLFGRIVGVRDTSPPIGLHVVVERPGELLALEGEHRFARYSLTFRLAEERLSATTHAAFNGPLGRVYRALVISSGFHTRVVNRILAATSRRAAARDTPPGA